MPSIAENYSIIAKKIHNKERFFIIMGDGYIYRPTYKWKKEPEEDDIVAFFSLDELKIGVITEVEWDSQFHDWFYTVVIVLPYVGRVQQKAIVSRKPHTVSIDRVKCVFRKVRKARGAKK